MLQLLTTTKIFVLNALYFILALTLIRSLLLMVVGKGIFIKAKVNIRTLYYPIFNLYTLFDICELSIFYTILLFIPVVNLVIFGYLSYKLSKLFDTNKKFRIGLILLPVIFWYKLSKSNYKYKISDEEYFKVLDESSKGFDLIIKDKEETKEEIEEVVL